MAKRSRSARLYEGILRKVMIPKGRTLAEVIMHYRMYKGERRYSLPLFMKVRENVDEVMAGDLQLFYMNTESRNDTLVIYLHGGAYTDEILPFHWLMLDKITSGVDAPFIIPDYPLAPNANFLDCYSRMEVFYRKCLKYYADRRIIMMGDSAGGGLAAGLSLYFAKQGLRVPDRLILLSPWVDLVMDDPQIGDYIKDDPLLKIDELKVDAAYWAAGHDLHDYRLSPIYGDLSVLKDVTLFAGTHELFYPDIKRFHLLLKEQGVDSTLYVGEGLNHVYPIFPTPEAEEAIGTICSIIDM